MFELRAGVFKASCMMSFPFLFSFHLAPNRPVAFSIPLLYEIKKKKSWQCLARLSNTGIPEWLFSQITLLFLGQLCETNIIYKNKEIEDELSDWSRKLEVRQGRITKALFLRQIKSWSLGICDRFHFALHSFWRCSLCAVLRLTLWTDWF